jgi:hypothetical protein
MKSNESTTVSGEVKATKQDVEAVPDLVYIAVAWSEGVCRK